MRITPAQLKRELAYHARKLRAPFSDFAVNEPFENECYFKLNNQWIEIDLENETFHNTTTGEQNVFIDAADVCYLAYC